MSTALHRVTHRRERVAREHLADGSGPVDVVTLTNARGMEVRFLSLGGIIVSVSVPDRDGAFADVTLGYGSIAAYDADDYYLGALIGRFANRIANGRFTLHDREYTLEQNDGANHLHGGTQGFHRAHWTVAPFSDERTGRAGAVLGYTSVAGEEGYPGTLDVRVTYTLTDDDEFIVDYEGTTDAPTPVNLTQHAYFNLAGHDAGDVLGHELTVRASRITPVDATQIPTGELTSVCGTPFDFTTAHTLGERIDAPDAQLHVGGGYDHNYVLDRDASGISFAARLRDPQSGRTLELFTTEPGLQLCTANALSDVLPGKHGRPYGARAGVALETQHFPDSPNHAHFPSSILDPGDAYRSRTIYRFSVT